MDIKQTWLVVYIKYEKWVWNPIVTIVWNGNYARLIYSLELWSMIIKLLWKACECCVHYIYYPCGPSKPLVTLLCNSKNPFSQTISELLWINKHSWSAVMRSLFLKHLNHFFKKIDFISVNSHIFWSTKSFFKM